MLLYIHSYQCYIIEATLLVNIYPTIYTLYYKLLFTHIYIYIASFYTYDASITAHNQSAYRSAFDFCTITDPTDNTSTISCIVQTVFNVANPIDPNYAINYNQLLVENGSCNILYSVRYCTYLLS